MSRTEAYAVQRKLPRPRKPRNIIPKSLWAVYTEVVAKSVELRRQGMTLMEVCEALKRLDFRSRTGKRWRPPQQIVKSLRSFVGAG